MKRVIKGHVSHIQWHMIDTSLITNVDVDLAIENIYKATSKHSPEKQDIHFS